MSTFSNGMRSLVVICCSLSVAGSAEATFHFMQIQKVIAGVNGDTTAQAIQLRMRSSFQNLVSQSRLRIWDAAGNPSLLIDLGQNVGNGSTGDTVFIASSNFSNYTSPSAVPDFTLTTLIPASVFAGGSLTFESDSGIIYWRLSWGNYAGPTTGSVTNDADGQFGPPWPGALPSSDLQALQFQGAATANSTNNADDYALSGTAAVFTNNARNNFTVVKPAQPGACCDDATGTCTPGTTEGECLAMGASFRYGGDGSDCGTIDPPCLAPTGACCDRSTDTCQGDVEEGECQGGSLEWSEGVACNDLDPPCEPLGACCDDVTGTCTDGLAESVCEGSGRRFGGDSSTCGTLDPPCEATISISLELVAGGGAGATATAGGTPNLVAPVFATHAGDGSGRLFIVDQIGFIYILDSSGNLLPTPFLDLTSKLVDVSEFFDERGLLGLAFHPDYANNGRFFVRYSAPRTGTPAEPCFYPGFVSGCHEEILAEYQVSADPNVADASSEVILFRVDEPEFNHDSGQVLFGPDGLLYFTLGDGGGGNDDLHLDGLCDAGHCAGDNAVCSVSAQDCADLSECISDVGFCTVSAANCSDGSTCVGIGPSEMPHGPDGNGQNRFTTLGSLLRIDVGSGPTLPDDFPGDPDRNYAIPAGNPFSDGVNGAPEIYAYGFRNPYRFSTFTSGLGEQLLWVADVGQLLFEEVNVVPVEASPGLLNYGWAIREGAHCFDPFAPSIPPSTCDTQGPKGEPLVDPVMEYLHPIGCTSDSECAGLGVTCNSDAALCKDEGGIAIIGGFVYRGEGYPPLQGKYVFGDFAQDFFTPSGRLYYMDTEGPEAFQRREFFITSTGSSFLGLFLLGIGEDEAGELYVLASDNLGPDPAVSTGSVFRLVPPEPAASGVSPRYLEISPPPSPDPYLLAVTPACPGPPTRCVGTPSGSNNIASLVNCDTAPSLTSQQWGPAVRVTGDALVPETLYTVQTDFGSGIPRFSPATTALTARHGDVVGMSQDGAWAPPDGDANLNDILAILQVFGQFPSAPPTYQTDLVGFGPNGRECLPDQDVDLSDVFVVLKAFAQISHSESTGCAEPCP